LSFHEAAPGRYVADAALALPGQWDLKLEAKSGGDSLHATRRLIAK
jgi:nitrogen fixation protein FixH